MLESLSILNCCLLCSSYPNKSMILDLIFPKLCIGSVSYEVISLIQSLFIESLLGHQQSVMGGILKDRKIQPYHVIVLLRHMTVN